MLEHKSNSILKAYYFHSFAQNNTYQGLIITNGTKTYAVFTYQCGYLNWAGEATIGFNAAAEYYANHPLASLTTSNLIACVHTGVGSDWNNVIYDLVPNPDALTTEPTPPPFSSIGMSMTYMCTSNIPE